MNTIDAIGDLSGKRVLLRTDIDVPVSAEGRMTDTFRIRRQRPMIEHLLARGARVLMVAHMNAAPSFAPLVGQLTDLVGSPVTLCKDFHEIAEFWDDDNALALFENLRRFPEEEKNDIVFAQQLVAGCDFYINNGFAESHRPYASVSAVASLVPAYAGLLLVEEIKQLLNIIDAPSAGKVIFMGGAKTSTKIPVIQHLLPKAQHMAIGGVIANDILKELGTDIGSSRADENSHELLAGLELHDSRLVLPTDFIKDGDRFMDIGSHSIEAFTAVTRGAQLIVWNGPFGIFEDPRFQHGTEAVARAIASSGAQSIIGGGDTIAAVDQLGLLSAYSFVSTGGGAMLAFLSGQQLPALKALGYYHD